jgi:CRP/FNR family transcriptional regulator, cyclic AMP receptor protein
MATHTDRRYFPVPVSLLENTWFVALPERSQQSLMAVSQMVGLSDGQVVFNQGDAVRPTRDGFYALTCGSLRVSSKRSDGKQAILSFLDAGNWFGELALIDGARRDRTVTAVGAVSLLVVEPMAFMTLMQDAAFALAVARLMSGRTRALMALVDDASLQSTRARVARRLVMLAHGDASRNVEPKRDLGVSHESLAMMLGMTRQTLAKQLHALTQAGAISQGYGNISVASMVVLLAEATSL